MKAKKYLLQIRKADAIIQNKMAEMKHWQELAETTTVSMEGDRIQASGSKQKMADAVCNYLSIQQDIQQRIDALVLKRHEIIETIEKLDNTVEYDILHKIYVQGMELYQLPELYDKSYSWVASMQGNALQHLQVILDERNNSNEL